VTGSTSPGTQDGPLVRSVSIRSRCCSGVLKEGAIAAGLRALMILLFIGSWRCTLIISIPFNVLVMAEGGYSMEKMKELRREVDTFIASLPVEIIGSRG
jgi:multidrug efflux pump subunit AcrB